MITANDIVKANEVLKNVVERTPLDFDRFVSEKHGATIYIKKENISALKAFRDNPSDESWIKNIK